MTSQAIVEAKTDTNVLRMVGIGVLSLAVNYLIF